MVKIDNAEKAYGSASSTASVGENQGEIFGIFYRGGIRHIATYIPYAKPPKLTLCGNSAGSATRSVENICPKCQALAIEILGKLIFK